MASDFSNLRIQKIIVHEIFKRSDSRELIEPVYSNSIITMDPVGMQTLQKRIVDAIGKDSHAIEMYIDDNSAMSTFDICSQMLDITQDGLFIDMSKHIPKKLAESQVSRNIPGGIVLVLTGLIGASDFRFIAVIKAELHDGFGKNNDDKTVELMYLANLALTPQQKLYKIGFLIEQARDINNTGIRTPEDFVVYVYDHNITRDGSTDFAQYFYSTFLGCSFTRNGKKLTKDFYYTTMKFINELNKDEEAKVDLISSLHTYLKMDRSTVVEPIEFANSYLPEDQKDNYLYSIEQAKIPREAFQKDLAYIADKLKRRKLSFSTNVKISAPSNDFERLIQVVSSNDEETTLRIKGKIVANQ